MPGRGVPLSRRIPTGAWKTLEENGQRLGSNSIRKLPASDSQQTWSSASITITWGRTPTKTCFSAIFSFLCAESCYGGSRLGTIA